MDLNEISADIVDAALGIHKKLGPGLLESVYELVLVSELERRGHSVRSQVPISFEYNGKTIENAFRIDVLVDNAVVVELKSTETFAPVHAKQLKTYLVLTGRKLGLLLNFGMEYMKNGIKRIANGEVPDLHALRASGAPCENEGAGAGMGSHGGTETRRRGEVPDLHALRASGAPCENEGAGAGMGSHGGTETRRGGVR